MKVLAKPVVRTPFGRPATLRIGEISPVANGINGPGAWELIDGIEIELVPVKRPDGVVRLHTCVTRVGKKDNCVFQTTNTLSEGKVLRFRVETGAAEVLWFEVVGQWSIPEELW